MIHDQESAQSRGPVKTDDGFRSPGDRLPVARSETVLTDRREGMRLLRTLILPAVSFLIVLAGCDGGTTEVTDPRFAQVGELRIDVELPVGDGLGIAEATLVWHSDGRWVLVERMRYRGVEGGERILNSRRNPGELAPEYSTLNQQLNDNPGLRLPGEVDQNLVPECLPPRSRVRVMMVDHFRDEVAQWTRCTDGGLFNLSTAAAGPDSEAARVINAAQLARSFTLGDEERSAFEGSIPFATLSRGEDSPAEPSGPLVFLTDDGSEPEGWAAFWEANGGGHLPLVVDWSSEMVLVGAPGLRTEAGHRIQVRRVLPVGTATRVESLEEIPGDFCSPAARDRYPYHIVVAPLGPRPVSFSDPHQSRIACGT